MCTQHHTAPTRWGRIWKTWALAVLGSFAAIETAGLIMIGSKATLSYFVRRLLGTEHPEPDEPDCPHRHIGRAALLTALIWTALHIGWGLLGWDGRKRPHERHLSRLPAHRR